ncbi:hypothetical protein LIER_42556 [Lithospermum erythrorhizon]|uniref:Uncharacterized protein n=1 Tax=Lithospermum erythrorhizon TaxID=34254 RepID=A0AAV3NIY7_LITER
MQRLEDEFEKKKSGSGCREVSLAYESETESALKKRKSCFSPIIASFGIQAGDQLDQEITRIFYTGGLPFKLARNPHYHRSYQSVTTNKIDGYVTPDYNKLKTTLLQKEKIMSRIY